MRPRDAPIAMRTENSRSREEERLRSRFATFAQATSGERRVVGWVPALQAFDDTFDRRIHSVERHARTQAYDRVERMIPARILRSDAVSR